MKKVTIRDVAAATGTSIATVSRALQGKPGVSEELREKLKEVAAKLNYVPRQSSKQEAIMMLVFPAYYFREGSHVFGRGVEVLYDRAAKSNIIITTQSDHVAELEACRKTLKEQDISVLVYFCGVPRPEIVELAAKQGTEVVLIHRTLEGSNVSTFISEDCYGGRLVADHFISMNRSNGIFLVPEGMEGRYSAVQRFRGFEERMISAHGRAKLVSMPRLPLDERIPYLEDKGGEFNGVFAYSDLQAKEFIEAGKLYGLNIPDEICVVGYNNSSHVSEICPELSSVYWPIDKLCHAVMDHVERYAAGQYDVFPVHMGIYPRLFVRGSSKLE